MKQKGSSRKDENIKVNVIRINESDAPKKNIERHQRKPGKSLLKKTIIRSGPRHMKISANDKEKMLKNILEKFKSGMAIQQKARKTNETKKNITLFKRKMRKNDTIAGLITGFILLIYFYELEVFIAEEKVNGVIIKKMHESQTINSILRVAMIMMSMVVCVFIFFHYKYKLELEKLLKQRYEKDSLKNSGLVKYMIMEMTLNMLICPPMVDSAFESIQLGGTLTISLDGILFSIALIRSYLLLRLYEQYSRWTNESAIAVCKKNSFVPSITFLVKSELKKRPYTIVSAGLFITMIILGVAVRTYEFSFRVNGQKNPFFSQFFNSFWFMMVTMTTVGFGDGYPLTHVGRLITLVGCILGTLLVSLMVVSLTNTSELSIGETRVFNEITQIKVKTQTQKEASKLLLVILQLFLLGKKLEGSDEKTQHQLMMKKFGLLSRMKRTIREFKVSHKRYDSYSSSAEDSLVKLNENGLNKLKLVYKNFAKTKKITKRCERVLDEQSKIIKSVDQMITFQNCISHFLVNFNRTYEEEEF